MMNTIPFLSLKDVTALHGAEINEAVSRVVNGDSTSREKRTRSLRRTMPSQIRGRFSDPLLISVISILPEDTRVSIGRRAIHSLPYSEETVS